MGRYRRATMGRAMMGRGGMIRHMRGCFNGRAFDYQDMTALANDERLPVGQSTVWTFDNDGPGMSMPHPIHIHGVRFRVLERTARPAGELQE
ncbi:MAG TPA: multicopper oxidase domain-containing protein [Burkholderiaceae bacterium]|nr:multicopper oxidase domain-containing protein [Burkholderiaceae bacterium]